MKYLLYVFLALNPFTYIWDINQLQKEAQSAYDKKNYRTAIRKYEQIVEELQLDHHRVYFNLAQAYFQVKDADRSFFYFEKSRQNIEVLLNAHSLNQLGYLALLDEQVDLAEDYFILSLKANPQNKIARYNLELLLRQKAAGIYQNQDSPQATSTNADPSSAEEENQKIDEESQTQLDAKNDSEANPEVNLNPDKLKDAKLNREKAEAILEALKNQETQYIQQLPRKRKRSSQSSSKW